MLIYMFVCMLYIKRDVYDDGGGDDDLTKWTEFIDPLSGLALRFT